MVFQNKSGIGFYQSPVILSVKIINPMNCFRITDLSKISLGGELVFILHLFFT
jgi:hypothetical protein